MLKVLLLSPSRQYTVDGQYIPSLFIEPEVRHDKAYYWSHTALVWVSLNEAKVWTSKLGCDEPMKEENRKTRQFKAD